MRISNFTPFLALVLSIMSCVQVAAQTIIDNSTNKFGIMGYLRSGFGFSEGGTTQAHFQMPGSLNKYSLGNQAETYGELGFNYTYFLNRDKSKSLDAVWMVSIYEAFGSEDKMSFNFAEQLYVRSNNLLGFGESIWFGNRFYDRQAIYMLDRQWMNPGQKGWGGGVENLLNSKSGEDIKIAAWQFNERGVTSFKNGKVGDLRNYTADIRWVNKPIAENTNINFALNYSRRLSNEDLGYEAHNGYGAFTWIDYKKKNITNTTALLYRQGANISVDHWNGLSHKENPNNDNLVLNDLSGAYSVEINNNFLYDDLDKFTLNAIFLLAARNYGTNPYKFENDEKVFLLDRGNMFYWATAGARSMYYVSKHFRPTFEYTYEYGHNSQLGVKGSLHKITVSPELSLAKGFYSRPVLRPFATYALWGDGLKGHIGTTPSGAPFANKTSGFTCGVQFEVWW